MRKKDAKQRGRLTSLSGHKEEWKSAPVEKWQDWSSRGGTPWKSIPTTVHAELEGDDTASSEGKQLAAFKEDLS